MFKIIITICLLSLVFAERPDWYPENPQEIEAECMKKYNVDAETIAKIRAFQLEDTPTVRSVLFCSAVGKNVYRPEKGFEPERFAVGLKYGLNVDCNVDFIRNCANKYNNIESQEGKYFHFFKCVFDDIKENCKKIE
ncbi:uncharacterized protein LOC105262425 [Musca domestica]|uniref:Uncharacterized protein LOC105262425 n=1 Tax=Musca domestica TaxID=7370 RepID=A0A9J7DA36_MUSDO|nr:uncharacterized protein LOC105262425 [Musca domestica]